METEMWQASVVYSERNRKRFLGLVFVFIYLAFNNWPLLLLVTFLVYQVEDKLFLPVESTVLMVTYRAGDGGRDALLGEGLDLLLPRCLRNLQPHRLDGLGLLPLPGDGTELRQG